MHPHETVLALSYESIETDSCIAGSFHSRVRITAQGVGCISTTLDPKWHGMLLFSLNNPTKKKIKVVLSARDDEGIIKPSPMITLVAWRVSEDKKESNSLFLRLDNPPMRSDIWSELTSKSVRFFHNRQHVEFCKLVEDLTAFHFTPSERIKWTNQLSKLLVELRVAIEGNQCEKDVRAVLIRIRSFRKETLPIIYNANVVPKVLQDDLDKLSQSLSIHESVNFMNEVYNEEYIKIIELTEREIQYQLLCDQVNQMHNEITKQVPEAWYKNKLAHIRKTLCDNIVLLIATVISVIFLIFSWKSESSLYISIVTAVLPFVLSVLDEVMSQNRKK